MSAPIVADDGHRYHDLVRTYYENIEYDHPDYVTSNRLSPWAKWSKWNRTAVKYYRYTGPSVTNL